MLKKKSPQRSSSTRSTTKPRRGPVGLRLVIAALRPDEASGDFAPLYASEVQDVGKRILKGQEGDSESLDNILIDVIDRAIFADATPDDDLLPSEEPSHARTGAFWAGVGACWYVMTQINGGVR